MKKLWNENRVLFLLMIILFICFIAIVAVSLTFFYSKDVDSYGSRLKDIDKYPFKEKAKNEYEDKLLENEGVKKVSLNTKGRVIYVHVSFDETIDLEDAKLIVNKSLENFKEDILAYYDIEFVLKGKEYTILGAKNTTIETIAWNNNTEVKEEEEVTDEK